LNSSTSIEKDLYPQKRQEKKNVVLVNNTTEIEKTCLKHCLDPMESLAKCNACYAEKETQMRKMKTKTKNNGFSGCYVGDEKIIQI